MSEERPKLVVVESPYAGDTDEEVEVNVDYARRCLADCFRRGEVPFASHLLYTQPGVLRDKVPEERRKGIDGGFAWRTVADLTAVYTDRGITTGMEEGVTDAHGIRGHAVEYRSLENDDAVCHQIEDKVEEEIESD